MAAPAPIPFGAWNTVTSVTNPDGMSLGNGDTTNDAMSADGKQVVFYSSATNLAPEPVPAADAAAGDTYRGGIYEADLTTGKIQLVAHGTLVDSTGKVVPGPSGTGYASYGAVNETPSVNADGRYVLFATDDALVPQDTNGGSDVYVRDMTKAIDDPTGYRIVSVPDGGTMPVAMYHLPNSTTPVTGPSGAGIHSYVNAMTGPWLSQDGNRALFRVGVPGSDTAGNQVLAPGYYWRDLSTNTTRAVDRTSTDSSDQGTPVPSGSYAATVYGLTMSGDGSKVAWIGAYTNEQPVNFLSGDGPSSNDTNDAYYLWRDMTAANQAQTPTRVEA